MTDGTQRRGTRGGQHAPKRLAAFERREQAWELRRLGFSYREIGAELGLSKSQAHRVVAELAADAAETLGTRVSECVGLDLDTLARMQRAKQAEADAGDDEAIAIVLRIMEARRKLLGVGSERGPSVAVGVGVQLNQNPNALHGAELQEMSERFAAMVREVLPEVNEIARANPGEPIDENGPALGAAVELGD